MATAVFVQKGSNIDYTATQDIAYMEVVPLISRIGVALEDIKNGEKGTVTLVGVFDLPAGSGAIAVGQDVFFNTSTGKIVTESGSNTVPAGIAIDPKSAAGNTARVRIG